MLYFLLLMYKIREFMDYKKKSLNKLNQKESYEEIDTRLASGWYVDDINAPKKKKNGLLPQLKKLLVIFLKINYLRSTRLNDSIKFIC